MARTCTVCRHPDRPAIDQAMVNRRPFRDIARHFSVGRMAAVRHFDEHLPSALAKATEAAEVAQADELLDQVRDLWGHALDILNATKAGEATDHRAALGAIREARSCLELLAELEQRIDRRPTVNLTLAPEWLVVRAELLSALGPYPEAKTAVAARLVALGGTRDAV